MGTVGSLKGYTLSNIPQIEVAQWGSQDQRQGIDGRSEVTNTEYARVFNDGSILGRKNDRAKMVGEVKIQKFRINWCIY